MSEPTQDAKDADPATGTEGEASPEQALEALGRELAAAREAQLRDRADLENQRRRLSRDLDQARRFANERLLADLLPVLDSLQRGLETDTADAAHLREGLELTLRQMSKVTGDYGLQVIDPAGEAFDPARHEAMSAVTSTEHAPGTVVQVFQKGYLLNERLLRPALVVVAKE